MSVHGAQQIFPFLQDDEGREFKITEEMYVAFQLLVGKKHANETLRAMAKALWPVVFVQGLTSTHVLVDELNFSNLRIEISNPPRQAEIGHLIRNDDLPSEKLDKILTIVRFQDTGADTPVEERETQIQRIEGLFNPDVGDGLTKLLPSVKTEDPGEMAILDAFFTTDQVLDRSEQFRKLYDLIRGNGVRWKSLEELLTAPYNRWTTDLAVDLKDLRDRYDRALGNADHEIDDSMVDARLKAEKDSAETLIQRNKKDLCSKLVNAFLPLADQLDELASSLKNLYVGETLISQGVQSTITAVDEQMNALANFKPQLDVKLDDIQETYKKFLANLEAVDREAAEKVLNTESELIQRLQQKEVSMEEIEAEKLQKVDEVAQLKDLIDQKFATIKEIIEAKVGACMREAEDLAHWAFSDDQTGVRMPIMRVFLPMFVALLEDDDMEERLCVILPQSVSSTTDGAIAPAHASFGEFEQFVEKTLADDIKKRSNFEFACETKNIFDNAAYKDKVMAAAQVLGEKFFSAEQQALASELANKLWKE